MDNILKNNETLPLSSPPAPPSTENLGYDVNDIPPEDLDSRWLRWKCLVCGYVYEGAVRLKVCPKCGNENPDKFEDAD